MIDKKSENFLKSAISKYDGNMEKEITIMPSEINLTYSELNQLCMFLYNKNCIESPRLAYNESDHVCVILTHKGLHYFEFKWEEIKSFFFRSILTPIVVSAITTLITLWLSA